MREAMPVCEGGYRSSCWAKSLACSCRIYHLESYMICVWLQISYSEHPVLNWLIFVWVHSDAFKIVNCYIMCLASKGHWMFWIILKSVYNSKHPVWNICYVGGGTFSWVSDNVNAYFHAIMLWAIQYVIVTIYNHV